MSYYTEFVPMVYAAPPELRVNRHHAQTRWHWSGEKCPNCYTWLQTDNHGNFHCEYCGHFHHEDVARLEGLRGHWPVRRRMSRGNNAHLWGTEP